jgi:uncharacterized protein (DUF779 family)
MTEQTAIPRVIATAAALEACDRLRAARGPLLFFQSGGCCDGSLPLCFVLGDLLIGEHDVLLGEVAGCPFFIDHRHYRAWQHSQIILDVAPGDPEGFSLPAGPDAHFIAQSRLCAPGTLTEPGQARLEDRP